MNEQNNHAALTIAQQYPPAQYNLLVPMQTVTEIADIQKPVMNSVKISTDLNDGEIYEMEKAKDEWRDSKGYYWFVGRNDDVIKCSGYRIGPFEVESALVAHPAVVECAVTAAPDPVRGKVVKASIILAKGYEPSDELTKELQDHVKHTTAPYKYPRIVEYVDDLPKTIGGKIKRKMIRNADGVTD